MTGFKNNIVINILVWIVVSIVFMFVLPGILLSIPYPYDFVGRLVLVFLVAPLFSVVIGISSGKDIKKKWFLPIVSTTFLLVSLLLFWEYGIKYFAPYAMVYLAIGLIAMIVSALIQKRTKEKKLNFAKGFIIAVFVLGLAYCLVPIKSGMTDGGTVIYSSGAYRITKYHRFASDDNTIDGVAYYYNPYYTRFIVGTEIKVFGFTVYDDTHTEPSEPYTVPFRDDIESFIIYFNQNIDADISLASVDIDHVDSPETISIMTDQFLSFPNAYSVSETLIDFIKTNPDNIFNAVSRIEVITVFGHITIDVSSQKVTEMIVLPDRLPGTVPEVRFEDVQHVYWGGTQRNQSTEEQREMIQQICPNAELGVL